MQTETKEMISMKWLKEDKKDKADGKKMSKEEIEILLKKGFMGLLEDQNGEEQESMDIDELIRKSKRTKYSMINDKYTITKMNLTTEKREKRVDINDPNFWDKVLPDENTPAQVLANKLRELKDSDDFMNEETQVEFCAELNDRVYEYIDRAKKKEISYQEEQVRLNLFIYKIYFLFFIINLKIFLFLILNLNKIFLMFNLENTFKKIYNSLKFFDYL